MPTERLTREEELEWKELKRLEEINRAQKPKPVHTIPPRPVPAPSPNSPPAAPSPVLVRQAKAASPIARDSVRVRVAPAKPEPKLTEPSYKFSEPKHRELLEVKGKNPSITDIEDMFQELTVKVTRENREKANSLVARQERFMATNEAKSLSYMRGGVFAAGAIGAGVGRYMAGEGEGEKTAGTGMGMAIGLTGAGIVSNDIKKELKSNRANLDEVLQLTENPSYYPFENAVGNETKIKKELNLGENLTYESEEFNSLRDRHRVRTERKLPPSIAPSDAPKIGQLPPAPPAPAATPPAPAATLAAPAAAPAPTALAPAALTPPALTATLAAPALTPPALTPPAPTAALAPTALTPPALTPPAPAAALRPTALTPPALTPPAPTAALAPAALTPPALTPAPPAPAPPPPPAPAPPPAPPPPPAPAPPPAPPPPPATSNIYKDIASSDTPRIEMPNEIGTIRDTVMPRSKIDITKQTAKREAMRAFHEANSASLYKGKNAAMLAATALLAAGAGLAFNTADKSSGLNSKRGNRI